MTLLDILRDFDPYIKVHDRAIASITRFPKLVPRVNGGGVNFDDELRCYDR